MRARQLGGCPGDLRDACKLATGLSMARGRVCLCVYVSACTALDAMETACRGERTLCCDVGGVLQRRHDPRGFRRERMFVAIVSNGKAPGHTLNLLMSEMSLDLLRGLGGVCWCCWPSTRARWSLSYPGWAFRVSISLEGKRRSSMHCRPLSARLRTGRG